MEAAGGARWRRAMGLVAAAVIVAAAGIVYLRPASAPTAVPVRPAAAASGQVTGGVFSDAQHGMVTFLGTAPSTGAHTYVTSDGGRTWRASEYSVTYLDGGATLFGVPVRGAGGPMLSADGGRSWSPLGLPLGSGGRFAFLGDGSGWLVPR